MDGSCSSICVTGRDGLVVKLVVFFVNESRGQVSKARVSKKQVRVVLEWTLGFTTSELRSWNPPSPCFATGATFRVTVLDVVVKTAPSKLRSCRTCRFDRKGIH